MRRSWKCENFNNCADRHTCNGINRHQQAIRKAYLSLMIRWIKKEKIIIIQVLFNTSEIKIKWINIYTQARNCILSKTNYFQKIKSWSHFKQTVKLKWSPSCHHCGAIPSIRPLCITTVKIFAQTRRTRNISKMAILILKLASWLGSFVKLSLLVCSQLDTLPITLTRLDTSIPNKGPFMSDTHPS